MWASNLVITDGVYRAIVTELIEHGSERVLLLERYVGIHLRIWQNQYEYVAFGRHRMVDDCFTTTHVYSATSSFIVGENVCQQY